MSVKISNLRIEAFRGIGDPLQFDLTSPLTLIYAPNGTGKTTLCEAAEWLLTGQVERLSKGHIFDRAILNSKFSSVQSSPSVEAHINFEQGFEHVRREVINGEESLQIKKLSGPSKIVTDHAWLNLLATGSQQSFTNLNTSSPIMRRWIKGSRFLTMEALAALVDSDEENAEKRLQVFSDILGVRHLLEAEKLFAEHVNTLNEKLKTLQGDLHLLEVEKNSLKDFQQGSIGGALIPENGIGIDSKLNFLENSLGITTSKSTIYFPTALRIERVESSYNKSRRDYEKRSSSLEKISTYISEQESNEEKLREITKNLIKLSRKSELSDARIQKKQKELQVLDGQLRTNENSLRNFLGLKSDLETNSKDLALEIERFSEILKIPHDNNFKLVRLRSILNHKGMFYYQGDEDFELRELHSKSNNLQNLKLEINKLDNEKKRLKPLLIEEDTLKEMEQNVSELSKSIETYSADFDVMARPLEKLRSSVNSYLNHRHSSETDSNCPVCGHEWDSLESMLLAVTSTIEDLPLFMKKRKGQCDILREKKSNLQDKITFAKNQKTKYELVEVELNLNQYRFEVLTSELKSHGISSRDPLFSLRRETARMRLRTKYTELLSSISSFESHFPGEDKLLNVPLAGFAKTIGTMLIEAQRKFEKLIESNREFVTRERHELNGMCAQHTIEIRELKDLQNKSDFLRRRISDFQILWHEVGNGIEWNSANFKSAHSEIMLRDTQLYSIAQTLEQTKENFKNLASAQRIDELEKETRILHHKITQIKNECNLAIRAQDDFKKAYVTATTHRMSELADIVNPLFSRMHSNRIYDEIQFNSKRNRLFLTASSADSQFSPDKDFSQGQRQDLALAIFIARARSIGGTFFLDEPVMHLDDLNRIGLLDIFRSSVLESSDTMNLVVTTSSKALARHIIQKFSSIKKVESSTGPIAPLRVYGLEGNARNGVESKQLYP